jgi:CheY-like chemotaxis protein
MLGGGEKPDLILMDFFMPGISGRETIEKIKSDPKTKGIPVAFLTVAEFQSKGLETLEDLEIADYIQKPVEIDDLITRVKKILG